MPILCRTNTRLSIGPHHVHGDASLKPKDRYAGIHQADVDLLTIVPYCLEVVPATLLILSFTPEGIAGSLVPGCKQALLIGQRQVGLEIVLIRDSSFIYNWIPR